MIEPNRALNYKNEEFETIFLEFDENHDDKLQKGEMGTLIKKLFKRNNQ